MNSLVVEQVGRVNRNWVMDAVDEVNTTLNALTEAVSWACFNDNVTAYLSSRSQVVQLLDDVEDEATGLLQNILGNRTSPIVDKAREYVMEHVSERISLADVASWAGVSIGYMSKVFKRVMGMSLVDYVNKMKVERAKEMMTRGHVRVNEVALALGFENIYYFSKVFKRVCGLSPSEWQKRQEAD